MSEELETIKALTGLELADTEPEDVVVLISDSENRALSCNTDILDVNMSVNQSNQLAFRMDSPHGTIKFCVDDATKGIMFRKELDNGSELYYTVFHRWNSMPDTMKKHASRNVWEFIASEVKLYP